MFKKYASSLVVLAALVSTATPSFAAVGGSQPAPQVRTSVWIVGITAVLGL